MRKAERGVSGPGGDALARRGGEGRVEAGGRKKRTRRAGGPAGFEEVRRDRGWSGGAPWPAAETQEGEAGEGEEDGGGFGNGQDSLQ